MAIFSETNLPRYNAEDLPGTTKKLYNFCREMQEMLLFVLANLDADNIEGYEEIFNRLTNSEGAVSVLEQTAESITAQVRQGEEKLAELQVTADGISSRVQDTEKGVSELRQTAEGLAARVGDNAGNISALQQTAQGLTSRVQDTEGSISTLQQTATGLENRVSNAEGSISSLKQTAQGLESRVSDAEGSISQVKQTANGLQSTVSDLNGKYTSLSQTVDSIGIEGLVTFAALSGDGTSEINGGNITTGNIDLRSVTLSNGYGSLTMGRGSTGTDRTRGARLNGPITETIDERDYANYFFASDAAARMSGEDIYGITSLYVSPREIHADVTIDIGSDERIKNGILYDVAERYGAFFRALKPARYRMNDSRSGRYHTGFIAQQLRDALTETGLTRQDLAALVQQDYDREAEDGGGGAYSIRYGELIALNTAMLQNLMAQVDALKAEVRTLKGGS
ncbi:hypothetical protein D7X33_08490 [Butyricicoccus sp. 1XD8-22]|nr:hypothetical protein D7X33_08490 [Butyricicoccus sp. 1XD8-22]